MADAGQTTRCLITNDSGPPEAICATHVLSDSEIDDPQIKTFLAKCGALNSSQNTISLKVDWKATWDAGRWIIVPTKDDMLRILGAMLNSKQKMGITPFENIFSSVHRRMVTFKPLTLGSLVFLRLEYGPLKAKVQAPPYEQFPPLECKAHPYLIMYRAFLTLDRLNASEQGQALETYALLHTIVALWKELSEFSQEARHSRPVEASPSNKRRLDALTQSQSKRPKGLRDIIFTVPETEWTIRQSLGHTRYHPVSCLRYMIPMAVNVQPVLRCLITNESVPSEAIRTAHPPPRSEVEDPKNSRNTNAPIKAVDDADMPSVVLEMFALLHSIVTLWKELSYFPIAEDEPPAPTPSTSAMKRPAMTFPSLTLPLKNPRTKLRVSNQDSLF
ncbi:hypothetical protein HETIRDRAFT_115684 [Heterobasidion irregulare TC 32-1]|uniref:Uncharacterized protein n=1 Tax=Heterobasidion irregulare (strain TC 32-1) TaxID=747525 RepID=W4K9F9_HETIT|nr:uncharacterized protein HETIRDRAFT_115684 [Heterobasidion irregulare TC 32-1]ETW81990.1 hypothetical protein HETIRDRAFT_115684 [Heterobasidion irregulare TC 32-1]